MCYQVQYQYLNKVKILNQIIVLINCKDLEHAKLNDFSLTCVILLNYPFHWWIALCRIVFNCFWQSIMFDKKQKGCIECIHLVTDDGLYDRKFFTK